MGAIINDIGNIELKKIEIKEKNVAEVNKTLSDIKLDDTKLPSELSKAAPRYGTREINFGNDTLRALYIVASDTKKGTSKSGPAIASG